MTGFHEVRFPDAIARGATGGPGYDTTILATVAGFERRNANWSQARGSWDVGSGLKRRDDFAALIAFFRARQGRAYGFRFKDWTDFRGEAERIGTGDGATKAFPLVKRYASGAVEVARQIQKPVAGTVTVQRDGSALASGWSVDPLTGTVSFLTAPAPGAVLTASFDFDVPVRFDTDQMDLTLHLVLRLPAAKPSDLPQLSAAAQLQAITGAVAGRVQTRAGATAEGGAWVATSARDLSGLADGTGGDLVIGLDQPGPAGSLIGVYAAQGRLALTEDGRPASARSTAIGVYVGVPLTTALLLDAHAGVARPDYTVGGSDFGGERRLASVGISGAWTQGGLELSPSLRASGAREQIPAHEEGGVSIAADTLTQTRLEAGLRVAAPDLFGAGGIVPHVEARLGRARIESGTGGEIWFATSQATIGLSGPMGAGQVSVDLSGGDLSDDHRSLSLTASYALHF